MYELHPTINLMQYFKLLKGKIRKKSLSDETQLKANFYILN